MAKMHLASSALLPVSSWLFIAVLWTHFLGYEMIDCSKESVFAATFL